MVVGGKISIFFVFHPHRAWNFSFLFSQVFTERGGDPPISRVMRSYIQEQQQRCRATPFFNQKSLTLGKKFRVAGLLVSVPPGDGA